MIEDEEGMEWNGKGRRLGLKKTFSGGGEDVFQSKRGKKETLGSIQARAFASCVVYQSNQTEKEDHLSFAKDVFLREDIQKTLD